jgi:hypothetical protein
MAAADASAAALALALVDAEFSAYRLGGDIGLELFVNVVVFGDLAAAIRTGVGQRRLERFGDVFRRRRWPAGVLAILFASLSPWFLGLRRRGVFGERSRLTLAGAFDLVEAFLQLGDATLQGIDDAITFEAPRAWLTV